MWSIPKADLTALYIGPLTQGENILVPAFPPRGFFITAWELMKVLAVIGSVLGGISVFIDWLARLRQ